MPAERKNWNTNQVGSCMPSSDRFFQLESCPVVLSHDVHQPRQGRFQLIKELPGRVDDHHAASMQADAIPSRMLRVERCMNPFLTTGRFMQLAGEVQCLAALNQWVPNGIASRWKSPHGVLDRFDHLSIILLVLIGGVCQNNGPTGRWWQHFFDPRKRVLCQHCHLSGLMQPPG